jgi:hypothetical protein
MSNPFPKSDLAGLLALHAPARLLALLAALRFAAAEDLAIAGIEIGQVQAAEAAGTILRFSLQRRMTDDQPTDVLALARGGARVLAEQLELDATSIPYSTRSKSSRSTQFLDHTLGRSAFALMLGAGLAKSGPALLSWESEAERLATSATILTRPGELVRRPLVADGLAVVAGPRGPEGLLVEIDRGTESAQKLMGPKFAAFGAWWQSDGPRQRFGVPGLRILTIAPDAKRTRRLLDACTEATGRRGSGLFWFASEGDLRRDGITAPVWSTPRAERVTLWS